MLQRSTFECSAGRIKEPLMSIFSDFGSRTGSPREQSTNMLFECIQRVRPGQGSILKDLAQFPNDFMGNNNGPTYLNDASSPKRLLMRTSIWQCVSICTFHPQPGSLSQVAGVDVDYAHSKRPCTLS